jgi:hypothetical protein
MIEDGYTYLEIRCVLAFSTKIESTWPFLKIMRRNNPNYLSHNEGITDRSGNPYQYGRLHLGFGFLVEAFK